MASNMSIRKVVSANWLWVFILGAKKLIIVGAAAISGWFRKVFKKKEKTPAGLPGG